MIDEVLYEQVLDIRQQAMYPDREKEFVILPDDNKALHMGYFVEEKPVSVFSLFLVNGELQFRKFATLPQYQGKGYGAKLMEWLMEYAEDMKFARLWCNARVEKTDFYMRFGFAKTADTFEKNGYEYVVMERRFN